MLTPALVVLATAIAVHAQTGMLKRSTTRTDKIDFGAGGTINIAGAPDGNVKITRSRGNEVSITAEIEVQASNEADLAKLAEITGFVTDESPGRITIQSVGSNNNPSLKKADRKAVKKLAGLPFRIDYTISVPQYCDLTVATGKGDVEIAGVEGGAQ